MTKIRKVKRKTVRISKGKPKSFAQNKPQKIDRRPIRNNLECHVCGEIARSHNFGGISCNCCRTFFRYYVLTNLKGNLCTKHLKKNCEYKGRCKIDKFTRKKCKTCRFLKCVKIGMDPAWVMAEYKKTLKSNSSENVTLSGADAEKIANLSKFYKTACDLIPYTFLTREIDEVLTHTKTYLIMIGSVTTGIRRFVYFAKMLPEFAKLSLHDQTNLLKRSVMEMVLLRDLMAYDIENRFFGGDKFMEKYPVVTEDEFISVLPAKVTEMYIILYKRIRSIAPDEESLMLLIPLALFSDSGGNESCTEFDDRQAINSAQELYAGLLEKYLKSTQGKEKGRLLFPRLLAQLAEITAISHLHQGRPLNMTDAQVDKMHQHLHELQKKTSQSANNASREYFKDPLTPLKQLQAEKECCKKYVNSAEKPINPKSRPDIPTVSQEATQPSLIHTFAKITGEFGIKQDSFESGPHVGIEKAYMRRMPELLACPWDSLVNEVGKLAISED